jgi:ABC-2 type transport system permease protein
VLGFVKLTYVQAKLYLREPMAAFFTLLFGPALFILLGFILGNAPDPTLGGSGYLDMAAPAYMAMVVCIVGLTAVPITSATRRETGVLRRFSATPLRPLVYFLTDVLVPYVLTLLSVLLIFVLGVTVFQVRFHGNLLNLLAGVSLGAIAFFSLGYALTGLIASTRSVILVGNVLLYPLVIFSGAAVPLEIMPETVRAVSRFLPLTHLVALLRGVWFGSGWGNAPTELAVLGGLPIVSMLIISRTFRWE